MFNFVIELHAILKVYHMIQKKLSIYFLFFLSILLVNFDLNATITKDSEDDNNQTEESKDKSADEDTKPENL